MPLDLLPFLCSDDIARLTGVTPRTARRWRTDPDRIPEPARRLLLLAHGDIGDCFTDWIGWHFGTDGLLYSPEGERFSPGDIRSIQYLRAHMQETRAIERRLQHQRNFLTQPADTDCSSDTVLRIVCDV